MKILSRACNYGIRALIYMVAKNGGTENVSIGEISEELDISFHFLTKTFQELNRANLLTSSRGPNGGVALTRPAKDISMLEVIMIIEGEDFFDTCLLGLPDCGGGDPCPIHEVWKGKKEKMREEFETTSLADLGSKVSEEKMRIAIN